MDTETYLKELELWRKDKEPELRNEDGWLALAGLFELREGRNLMGSDPTNAILLPEGKSPPFAGDITLENDVATLHALPDVKITVDDKLVAEQVMQYEGVKPTRVMLGPLIIQVIRRAQRRFVRVHDRTHPARESFAGRQWYPGDPAWRIEARFVEHANPRTLQIDNTLGDTMNVANPGYAVFNLKEQEIHLEALSFGYTMRFIIRDATSGHGTYPAGRFLDTDEPKDDKLVLDFNRAYSPPCAFTDFATCPLPPPQNILNIPIEAGERDGGHP